MASEETVRAELRQPAKPSRATQITMLFLAFITRMTSAFSGNGLAPLAPLYKADLSLSTAQVGMFVSARQLTESIGYMGIGWLVDRAGPRWPVSIGGILLGLCLIAFSRSPNFAWGLILLALAGPAVAMVSAASMMAVFLWFSSRGRGTAMGISAGSGSVNGIIASVAWPAVASLTSWRVAISIQGLIAMLAGTTFAIFYHNPPTAPTAHHHVSGQERMREVVGNRDLWIVILFATVVSIGQQSFLQFFMLSLQQDFLLSLITAGTYLGIAHVGGLFGRVVWGIVSDVVFEGRRKGVLVTLGATTIGMYLILSRLPVGAPLWSFPLVALGFGLSAFGWQGIFNSIVPELAPPQLAATAISFAKMVELAGSVIGVPIYGYLADVTGSYRPVWLTAAAANALVTLATALKLRERHPGL
ncbi:MAG: MFS transporter [Chloroflexi bacterium]|nr:MFS transporter [Chloroflexota bacterium]